MHGIAVHMLLRSDREIKRLKRKGPAAIELRQQFQNFRVSGNGSNVVVELPRILNTQIALVLDAGRRGKIDAVMG